MTNFSLYGILIVENALEDRIEATFEIAHESTNSAYGIPLSEMKQKTSVHKLATIDAEGLSLTLANTPYSPVKKVLKTGQKLLRRVGASFEEYVIPWVVILQSLGGFSVGDLLPGRSLIEPADFYLPGKTAIYGEPDNQLFEDLFPLSDHHYYYPFAGWPSGGTSGGGGASGAWEPGDPGIPYAHSDQIVGSDILYIRYIYDTGWESALLYLPYIWLHYHSEADVPNLDGFEPNQGYLEFWGLGSELKYGGQNPASHPLYGDKVSYHSHFFSGGYYYYYQIDTLIEHIFRLKPPFPNVLPGYSSDRKYLPIDCYTGSIANAMSLGQWLPRAQGNKEAPIIYEALTSREEPLEAQGEALKARRY
jgi:hypothetical protein